MTHPAYTISLPARPSTAVLFASPHSGRAYPAEFVRRAVLDEAALRSSEDAFVDLLFDTAPEAGAPFLAARTPRAFVDFNRAPDELDPALIEGVRTPPTNPRVASGLGVIPRVVAGGRAIRHGRMPRAEAEARLVGHWRPYHAALGGLIAAQRARFGRAIVIDCHSMPHEAVPTSLRGRAALRPEVILGDRFGAAAAAAIVDRVEAAFQAAGFRVARNAPFAGAYVTQAYGRPALGQHVVQVEIDRALYMDEARVCPHAGFSALRQRIATVVAAIAEIGRDEVPLAAE